MATTYPKTVNRKVSILEILTFKVCQFLLYYYSDRPSPPDPTGFSAYYNFPVGTPRHAVQYNITCGSPYLAIKAGILATQASKIDILQCKPRPSPTTPILMDSTVIISNHCSVIALKRHLQAVLTLADVIPGERDSIYTQRLEKRREIRSRNYRKPSSPTDGPSCAPIP